jgi:hypothetical protein
MEFAHMREYLENCSCGSGFEAHAIRDARGIFIGYMCQDCKVERLSGYRQDVLTDPNYKTDEPIEPED